MMALDDTNGETNSFKHDISTKVTIQQDDGDAFNVNLCYNAFNTCYDVMAALISICDVITDFIILITFYQKERYGFFIASLVIIILANLSYSFVFVYRYQKGGLACICCVLLCILPISPILSYLFYFIDDNKFIKNLVDNICCVLNTDFRTDEYSRKYEPNESSSQLRNWMEGKLSRQIGFILEAWIEALPQSILQLIAICYYDELSIIYVISISLSMLSVSSKALILSAMTSINAKTSLFSWICAVTDFFSIFFIISWIFYTHADNVIIDETINIIQQIYLYKFFIFTIPLCFICSLVVYKWGFVELFTSFMRGEPFCIQIIVGILSFLIVTILWIFGLILGAMILEISSFMYIAYFIYHIGHGRIPKTISSKIWLKLIKFVKRANSYTINNEIYVSKKQDKIIRICCINRQLLLMKTNNESLHQYLELKEHGTQYRDVRYKDIRNHANIKSFCDEIKGLFLHINNISDCIGCVIFGCFIPMYLISKLINILFPYLILILLHNVLDEIHLFQLIMLYIYICLQFLILVFFVIIYEDEHIVFHLLPTHGELYRHIDDKFYSLFISYYQRLVEKPIILSILCHKFGQDIGNLLFTFFPIALEEEEHANILKLNSNKYTNEQVSWDQSSAHTLQKAMFRTRY